MSFLTLIAALMLFIVALRIDKKYTKIKSRAALVPAIWLTIVLSRNVSRWLNIRHGTKAQVDFVSAIETGQPIDQLFFLIILISGLVILVKRRKIVYKVIEIKKTWIFLFVYCFISILWSDHQFISFKRYIKDFNALLMVLVIITEKEPINTFKAIMKRNMFLLVPLSIVFCKFYPDIGRYQTASWNFIYTGVTTHKNLLAILCLINIMVFLIDWIPLLKNRKYLLKPDLFIVYTLYLLLSIYLLKFANSMTTNACLIIGLSIFFSKFLKKNLIKVIIVLVIMYTTGLTDLIFSGISDVLLGIADRDLTLSGRTDLWEAVLGIKNNPIIGTGYSAFWLGDRLRELIEHFIFLPKQAHNGYLEVYLNLGIIGLMSLLFAIYCSFRIINKKFYNNDYLASFKISFFTIFLIHNFTEATFLFNASPLWFVFLFVVFLGNKTTKRNYIIRNVKYQKRL